MEAAAPIYTALGEIRANFPDLSTLRLATCPDADIESKSADPKRRHAMPIAWNWLLRRTGGATDKTGDIGTYVPLTQSRLVNLPVPGKTEHKNPSSVTAAVERWNRFDYVAVVRPIGGTGADARSYATTFTAGHYNAWLVVFDKASRQPMCQAPLSVKSSATVAYATKAGDSTSDRDRKASHAVKEDLKKKIKPAMKAALAEISKVLK